VIREAGGDRSAVTGGTRVLSDYIKVKITSNPGETFLDRMIALVEGASRQKTPNEIALNILLAGLTIIFLLAVVTLQPFAIYSGSPQTVFVLVSLLVCLIPTTIGGLLVGDRHCWHGPPGPAQCARHVGPRGRSRRRREHAAARQNRHDHFRQPPGHRISYPVPESPKPKWPTPRSSRRWPTKLPRAAPSLSWPKKNTNCAAANSQPTKRNSSRSPRRRACPASISMAARFAKALPNRLRNISNRITAPCLQEVRATVERIASSGGTPLVVSENRRAMGVIHLKDVVKGGIRDRFAQLRAMGIRTVMITGDNPLTAAAIAREAGVDDFLAQATPEDKLKLIRSEQAGGKLVAMTGDGTNDAPALAQADVGVAMNTGTQAAKEAGNMVDLDSNPTKLIEVVEIGKAIANDPGALTTFSIANDVAKYFAIIPAMFAVTFPVLNALNIMHLKTPQSAVLSAVIFNALIIIALIPLALRGVKYRAMNAEALLRRNLFIYGVGGLIAPFVGIKLIDMLITAAHLA
jgi:potassium-transporting ATPase ATP-binding subunit